MQTPRVTRSSVLGKRAHLPEQISSSSLTACEQLQTPESSHKRLRTSSIALDGDGNKENVPPFNLTQLPSPVSARASRALRRNSTETVVSPSRSTRAPRRTVSTSEVIPPVTPASAIAQLSLSTPPPTPPTLILPVHARARALLRPTCNDIISMPARDSERQIISDFITRFAADSVPYDGSPCLYISGPPGTGKTALVNSILHSLDQRLGETKVVTVNCMALKDVDALWQRILEDLESTEKGKVTRKQPKGRQYVEDVLSSLRTKCILILDELDHIASTTQTLTSLFTLPASSSGFVRVIGIANTHTLGTSISSSAASSLYTSQVRTLHFAPYTPAQLHQILQSRLAPLYEVEPSAAAVKQLFPGPALTLLTKKVAALTGDVRCLFEVLRGAIDLAVSSKSKAEESDDAVLNAPEYVVTPANILSALKAYAPSTSNSSSAQRTSSSSNSEIVSKIQTLGLQARLALLALMLAFKRTEAGLGISAASSPSISCSPFKRSNSTSNLDTDAGIDQAHLYGFYSTMLSRGASDLCAPVTRNEFNDLVTMLEGVGLITVGSSVCSSPTKVGRRTLGRSASFGGAAGMKRGATGRSNAGEVKLGAGVWSDEILRGLGIQSGAVGGDIIEEEIRVIWSRELVRVGKELKTLEFKSRKNTSGPVEFLDASED